jgi:16S rRNA (cytosine1402-N4)-methyltransferase
MTHTPVLLQEVMSALDPKPGEFFIDGTLGGGGHAEEIIKRLGEKGTLLGLDWNKKAAEEFQKKTKDSKTRIIVAPRNFAELPEIIKEYNLPKADGLLLDLGFSSFELEEGRGFSFLKDEPLLMTYSDESVPLWMALRDLSQEEIYRIVRGSGERFAGKISEAIFRAERKGPVKTTGELVRIIEGNAPKNYEAGRIHPATRTFLAFRLYVNRELDNLRQILSRLAEIVSPGGRIAVITFQSLEDRIVKESFREMQKAGTAEAINKKPIAPGRREIIDNPRARSAKLRAIKIS